jgi:hypothetical protein
MPQGKAASRTSPAGLAAVAVSLIIGYPVQSMIDPEGLGTEEYLESIGGPLGPSGLAA